MRKLALAAAVVGIGSWAMYGQPRPGTPAPAARAIPPHFASQLRENAPVRERLARDFPEQYQALEKSTGRDLRQCVVTSAGGSALAASCY